jgi:hypothetical protein
MHSHISYFSVVLLTRQNLFFHFSKRTNNGAVTSSLLVTAPVDLWKDRIDIQLDTQCPKRPKSSYYLHHSLLDIVDLNKNLYMFTFISCQFS